MDKGEHQWIIDAKLLNTILNAKNKAKFITPKFKMGHLIWQIEYYPNGNSSQCKGSFGLYLRLMSMPLAWKDITMCRTFKCKATQSGYTAVSKYQKNTSLGWPDFTCTLSDIKSRQQWLKHLKFIINIKVLQIRLYKNNGMIFYETKISPFRALQKQTLKWKLDETILHEMKNAEFKKGFISKIYNDTWCFRCYPNGKSVKGDFVLQLQMCGLPFQTEKVSAEWTVNCVQGTISSKWTTEFDYKQSCWGWGSNQLSFDKFRKYNEFEIIVEIIIDNIDNIIAMSEWEKYVNNKTMASLMKYKNRNNSFEDDEKKEPIINIIPPPPPHVISLPKPSNEMREWIENRLQIQDEILEELKTEVSEIKNEVSSLLNISEDKHSENLKNEIIRIQNQVKKLSEMRNVNFNDEINESKQLTEEEKVETWFQQKVKLPQFSALFIEQGFDSLDVVQSVTKEDLIAMGIDKIGYQRKIMNSVKLIEL